MNEIPQAVANLDGWLDTMRVPGGYGGPVVHWWQNCLQYTGSGLDWRYEGIISGYLTLWQRTGQPQWLEKACRAGDDLVAGQLPAGNYRASSFEQNPYPGGTPHEAAADVGLLHLAKVLRTEGDERWQCYQETAVRNLTQFYLQRMWDPAARSFRDDPNTPSLVPNKACTLVEALFAWAALSDDVELIETYALPTLTAVVALQLKAPHPLAGGIAQNRIGRNLIAKYFPYYIARCIPALLLAYKYTEDEQWLAAAIAAFHFVVRLVDENGLLPQVVYPKGINRYPQWVAPLGDVLRAADLLTPYYGLTFDKKQMEQVLLAGQLPSGGIVTGHHFASQVNQKPNDQLPDFRDCIPVVGWNDKAFRYLVSCVPQGQTLPASEITDFQKPCFLRGQEVVWRESNEVMSLSRDKNTIYRWDKGQNWTAVAEPEVLWK